MRKTLISISVASTCLACASSALAGTHISQTWKLHEVSQKGSVVIDEGTVAGPPFGSGKIRLRTTARPDGSITFTFRERLAHGSVTGKGRLTYRFTPSHDKVLYRGTGKLTAGTGRYKHTRSSIKVQGTGYPDAHAQISISST